MFIIENLETIEKKWQIKSSAFQYHHSELITNILMIFLSYVSSPEEKPLFRWVNLGHELQPHYQLVVQTQTHWNYRKVRNFQITETADISTVRKPLWSPRLRTKKRAMAIRSQGAFLDAARSYCPSILIKRVIMHF